MVHDQIHGRLHQKRSLQRTPATRYLELLLRSRHIAMLEVLPSGEYSMDLGHDLLHHVRGCGGAENGVDLFDVMEADDRSQKASKSLP